MDLVVDVDAELGLRGCLTSLGPIDNIVSAFVWIGTRLLETIRFVTSGLFAAFFAVNY